MKKSICLLFWIILATLRLSGEGWPNSKVKPTDSGLEQQPVYWYEREVRKRAWMALDEVAVFPKKGQGAKLNRDLFIKQLHPNAVITKRNSFLIYLKTPERMERKLILERVCSLRELDGVRQASPVFYTGKKRHPYTRLVLTGEIIVQFPQECPNSKIAAVEKKYCLERLKSFPFAQNTFLYRAGEPLHSLKVANDLYESGQANYAYPNWLRSRSKRAVPNDTLFPDQWHLDNTGQGGGTPGEDVNITSVWDTYRASDTEVVAIVDDGLEIGHEDLSDNVLPGESYDYVGRDTDPTAGDHGTSCAGVAAAAGFNGQGVTGAAPSAGLVGHRLLGAGTDANEADALTRNNGLIDIYSNSWGPSDSGQFLEGPGPLTESALEWGVANGRGGLGSIYVWAGGNGANNDNSNYDGYANSRYTIAVAASTNSGVRSSYSEKGANILVNAPSSGGSLDITTTDRTGAAGYDPGNYTDTFGGTSSAAPLVSGIIALMLEANPSLTWRDVQHILIATSEHNDIGDADWDSNGAGYLINYKYGFGRIDAEAAVNAADPLAWTPPGAEENAQGSSSPDLSIPDDDQTGVTDTIYVSEDISAEFVEVYFTAADHTWWGDLEITLISPDGTESVLAELHNSGGAYDYDNWRFGSVRHFGESSQGNWTLRVKDLLEQDTGTFQSWTLKIYGTSAPKTQTVTATAGSNGTITPSGAATVNYGADQTFTITPDSGYVIEDVLVDGSTVGGVTIYTFSNVIADHTIEACFAVNNPPTANAGPDQTWVQDLFTSGRGDGDDDFCFIATAAYGSPMEPQVKILREFRDRYLLTNPPGRALVSLYYTYSPPLADFIASHNQLRAVVRCCLTPLIGVSYVALNPITAMALLSLIFACKVWWERHHRRRRTNTFSTRKHHLYS